MAALCMGTLSGRKYIHWEQALCLSWFMGIMESKVYGRPVIIHYSWHFSGLLWHLKHTTSLPFHMAKMCEKSVIFAFTWHLCVLLNAFLWNVTVM